MNVFFGLLDVFFDVGFVVRQIAIFLKKLLLINSLRILHQIARRPMLNRVWSPHVFFAQERKVGLQSVSGAVYVGVEIARLLKLILNLV